ncbi:MAG: hypothetical protein JWO83_1344 [Caulobacteraceae bacterium]|nr:hypothetical protein [Caulobacteraceae bacterium]
MQILMSQAAHARVREPLAALGEDLDVVTFDVDGVARRDGVVFDRATIDPEVFWLSLDLLRFDQAPRYFQQILGGARGKWAQVFAAGLDNPAFTRIMAKGLRLTKSSAQAAAIAEYVMCNALSLLNPIAERRKAQARHEWRFVPFREIGSTRWLIVGFGAIGHEIARRLRPFGAHLTVARRNVALEEGVDEVRPVSELAEMLPNADVVVLACALNEDTRDLAGAAFFAAMKPGALLVNIARGALIDEDALKAGLDRDQPAMVVLDVFRTEPLPADSWLWAHPKVRVSGHCSNAGDGVLARGDALFLENLRRYRAGEPLLNEARPSEVGL